MEREMSPQGSERRARKRGVAVIYVNTFLMYGGFFMVIPMIAVHYVDGLGWAAASIGLVLAVRQFVQQGLSFIGGILADRYGARGPILTGLAVRGVGFAWMAFADSFPILLASATLAALGGAFFEAPKSAAGAALTEEHERPSFYATLGIVGNLGLTLGPLLGALLLQVDFTLVALAAGGCFALATGITWLFLPPVTVASAAPARVTDGLALALRDRAFLTYTVLLMGFWFMAVQYTVTLPLIATDIGGDIRAAGLVLALYAALTVILQYPGLRLARRYLATPTILIVGVVIMAVGMGGVAAARTLPILIGCVALFAVGGLLAQPTQQTLMAQLASPTALGSYFAVGSYGLAIGGGLGAFAGGVLYGWGERFDLPALPWLVFGGIGLMTAAGLRLFCHSTLKEQPSALSRQPSVT